MIRQYIEIRIKNALNIFYVKYKGKEARNVKAAILIDFVFDQESIELPTKDEKSMTKKIHSWTNYFIHGGFLPELWMIELAYHLLEPLSEGGKSIVYNFKLNTTPIIFLLLSKINTLATLAGVLFLHKFISNSKYYHSDALGAIKISKKYYENSLDSELKEFIAKEKGWEINEIEIVYYPNKSPEALLY